MEALEARAIELPQDASALLVTGPAASGKTGLLVRHAAELLALGVSVEDILIVSASVDAAEEFRRRLLDAGASSEEITITTPLELACDILSDERAMAATGRVPRLLGQFETSLLFEDLKMLGGDQKRNREIVKFLLREWTELGEDKERFIISSEELNLHEGLKERLKLREGMLAHELANTAVHFLRSDEGTLAAWRASYVLVDDAQNMCLASQVLADMLASVQIVLAGDPLGSCEVLDPYPFPDGLQAFAERHEESVRVELNETGLADAIREAVCAFSSEAFASVDDALPSEAQAHGEVFLRAAATPDEERAALVRELSSLPEDEVPRAIVVVPHSADAVRLKMLLDQCDVPSAVCGREGAFVSVKDLSSEAAQLSYALLRLACDPLDGVAWRTWFSQDDVVHGSGLWRELEEVSKALDIHAASALLDLDACGELPNGIEMPHRERILVLRDEALDACDRIAGLRGTALVEALAKIVGVEAFQLDFVLRSRSGDASCEELVESLYRRITFGEPVVAPVLRIGTPASLAGLRARRAYVTTVLDGCYPTQRALDATDTVDHRRYYLARDERVFYTALTRGDSLLEISWPLEEDLECAVRAGMGISRVFGTSQGRRARLAPSRFISKLH